MGVVDSDFEAEARQRQADMAQWHAAEIQRRGTSGPKMGHVKMPAKEKKAEPHRRMHSN